MFDHCKYGLTSLKLTNQGTLMTFIGAIEIQNFFLLLPE